MPIVQCHFPNCIFDFDAKQSVISTFFFARAIVSLYILNLAHVRPDYDVI